MLSGLFVRLWYEKNTHKKVVKLNQIFQFFSSCFVSTILNPVHYTGKNLVKFNFTKFLKTQIKFLLIIRPAIKSACIENILLFFRCLMSCIEQLLSTLNERACWFYKITLYNPLSQVQNMSRQTHFLVYYINVFLGPPKFCGRLCIYSYSHPDKGFCNLL